MTTLQEFRCEVCGLVTTNPVHWFVIRCGDSDLNRVPVEFRNRQRSRSPALLW
jgi:hypothetical protein